MKKFQKAFAGVSIAIGALCAVAAAAPAADAATGKALVVAVKAQTKSVMVHLTHCDTNLCGGSYRCRALPAHNAPSLQVVPNVTVYNGDKLGVAAYDSADCTGSSTYKTGEVTVSSNNSDYVINVR